MRLDRVKVKRQMRTKGIVRFGDLCKLIEVEPATLSRWFAAERGISFESLSRLCTVLDCTVDQIVTYDDLGPFSSALASEPNGCGAVGAAVVA